MFIMVTLIATATANTITFGIFGPFDAHCCHMGTTIKHPVLDRCAYGLLWLKNLHIASGASRSDRQNRAQQLVCQRHRARGRYCYKCLPFKLISLTNMYTGQLLVGPNALWPTQPKFWPTRPTLQRSPCCVPISAIRCIVYQTTTSL